jgi:dipeptidase E
VVDESAKERKRKAVEDHYIMKLFLASLAINDQQAIELAKLVGKEQKDIKLALIENAADGEEGPKEWVAQNREMIQGHAFEVEIIDLNQYRGSADELKAKLAGKDVIWCGGGNTYYLRWLLKDVGADKVISELVQQGKVYGGGSAGAIVAGPTLKHFEAADDIDAAPELIMEGLRFTDSVVVPHMDNAKFAAIIHGINYKLKTDGYKTVPLGDMQTLIVDGDAQRVV